MTELSVVILAAGTYGSDDFTISLLCVGAVLSPGLIFGAIGFLTGINWARTK